MGAAGADMDAESIRRCQQGDMSALDDLVVRYQLPAVRVAYILVRDRSIAEDIVQESFLLVYRKCRQFRNNEPFAPWFYRIVLNRTRQHLRTVKRHPAYSLEGHLERYRDHAPEEFHVSGTPSDQCTRTTEDDPALRLEQAEVRAAVLAILHTLTQKQREVLAG